MKTFTIDNQEVKFNKNKTILEVANDYGIYIPTLCYLPKIKPITSCRLCVVEVEGVNGFVLSCQAPAKEGLVVRTNSEELFKHRQNIMKFYNVNHPLECGVCDKSGECLLQNKTIEFELQEQTFAAKEQRRELKNWGTISYDPYLCILCERCVRVCNEIIGDNALEIFTGGYKSIIQPKGGGDLKCTECGECIAVCPVGALISTDFKYISNAWELTKIPSNCVSCSSTCQINYEVKNNTIYRITNDIDTTTICHEGRFNFSIEKNKIYSKNFEDLKSAKSIIFDSFITNEEALILENLREDFGFDLINYDGYHFSKFLESFSKSSGKSLYSGTLEDIKESDFILILGSFVVCDNPQVRYRITQAKRYNNSYIVMFHPIEDVRLKGVVSDFIRYEVGTEEGVVGLVSSIIYDLNIPNFDKGYLSSESNVSEEELEKTSKRLKKSKKWSLLVGSDIYYHKNAKNIAMILGAIERLSDFKVILIPPQTNSLGVSLICNNLKASGVGINYRDLNFPTLLQQEGTITNINKRVVPINSSTKFGGQTLNQFAKILGMDKKYTIDYTLELPQDKGYKPIPFDEIEVVYGVGLGYEMKIFDVEIETQIQEISPLPEYNGAILYFLNRGSLPKVEASSQFALAFKIKDSLSIDGIVTPFNINEDLKGTIGVVYGLKKDEYRYRKYKE